jgi:hypothetical protein
MGLRDVQLGDVDAYVRMRCDPVMMADLGGPLPGKASRTRFTVTWQRPLPAHPGSR